MSKAIVRQHIERIAGVTRTWFEWVYDREADELTRTLVVEVEFDTDPNSEECRSNVMDAIEDTARGVLQDDTTMLVSGLKIVPRGRS
jgi:hypothetical protein